MLAEKENGRPQTHLPSCSADGQVKEGTSYAQTNTSIF